MRRFYRLLSAVVSLSSALLLAPACLSRAQEPRQSEYTPTATIKDIMESIVDPSADVVWDSVATIVAGGGIEDRAPRTDEEWADVRHGGIRLVESANLLMIPGRLVARAGEKSETPGVELEPEEMEALINQDRGAWNDRVEAFRSVSEEVLRAIDAKNTEKLFEVGDRLDTTCENCHRQYWYPNEKIPDFPSELTAN